MALIICKECGREISDTATSCPHCGYTNSSKVTIYGYTENFAINPKADVYMNGNLVGSVSRNDKIELDITDTCELKIKCSLRSTTCTVRPGDCVLLSFDRVTGALSATATTKENISTEINIKRGKDSTNVIWIVIACATLFILGLCLSSL